MSYANRAVGLLQRIGYDLTAVLTVSFAPWSLEKAERSYVRLEKRLADGERIPSLWGNLMKVRRVGLVGTDASSRAVGTVEIDPKMRVSTFPYGSKNPTSEAMVDSLVNSGAYKRTVRK